MAKNITASGATIVANDCERMRITVNNGFTGTLAVSTANGGTVATVLNPATGQTYNYGGLTMQGAVTVNPSATCDLSVTIDPKL